MAKKEMPVKPRLEGGELQKSRSVSLSDDAAADLKKFGNGNLSRGCRRAAKLIRRWSLWEKTHQELGEL